jgi:hypothetical protein
MVRAISRGSHLDIAQLLTEGNRDPPILLRDKVCEKEKAFRGGRR